MRKIKCHKCGKIIEAEKEVCYCDSCRLELQKNSAYNTKNCIDCGIEFFASIKTKRCPSCTEERKRKQKKEYRARARAGKQLVLGSEMICEYCKKTCIRTNYRQKYCPDCREKATREAINLASRKYMAERYEKNKENKKKLKTNRKICVICGKEIYDGTTRITCSEECAKKRRSEWYRKADIKRGKIKLSNKDNPNTISDEGGKDNGNGK